MSAHSVCRGVFVSERLYQSVVSEKRQYLLIKAPAAAFHVFTEMSKSVVVTYLMSFATP